MQAKSEMQVMQTTTPAVSGHFQSRENRGERKENESDLGISNSRSKRRNRQKKKTNGRAKSASSNPESISTDSPKASTGRTVEDGRQSRRGPFKGINSVFCGSPSSCGVRKDIQSRSTPMKMPIGPSRKRQNRSKHSGKGNQDGNERRFEKSAASIGSANRIQEHSPNDEQNGLKLDASTSAAHDITVLERKSKDEKSSKENQKKRRNRKRGKRSGCSKNKPEVPRQHERSAEPVCDKQFLSRANTVDMSVSEATNLPFPIPMVEFEQKSDEALNVPKALTLERVGCGKIPVIKQSPRKDASEKLTFSRSGRVVRILQNKDRGMDTGCTQEGTDQSLQNPMSQVSAEANQAQEKMGYDRQRADTASFSRNERIRSELRNVHDGEKTVGRKEWNGIQGPSPGASSSPLRNCVSSQDVRNNLEDTPRVRKTPWKPRRKRF